MKDEPLIHLWPGASFHEDGYIVANRTGLKYLLHVVETALKTSKSVRIEAMTGDGEGYTLHIIPSEEEIRLALPYTDDYAEESRENAIYPWDM